MIEIPVPLLFFSPVRRLRLGSFYLQVGGNPGLWSKKKKEKLSLHFGFILQVLLQVLIILSGNYNFFNLLTLALCLSLLDDQHIHFWLRKRSISSDSGMNKKRGPFFLSSHLSRDQPVFPGTSHSFTSLSRLCFRVVALLPAGAAGLVSPHCRNDCLLRHQAGYD